MDDGATRPDGTISLAPEHAWEAAAPIVYPLLRPAGTHGLHLETLATPRDAAGNVEPLVDVGPAGLIVAYVLANAGLGSLRSSGTRPVGSGCVAVGWVVGTASAKASQDTSWNPRGQGSSKAAAGAGEASASRSCSATPRSPRVISSREGTRPATPAANSR